MCKQKLFVIVTAVVGVVALFLPFVSFMGISANAFSMDSIYSYVLIAGFAIPIVLVFLGSPAAALNKISAIGIIVCALAVLTILILNMVNLLQYELGLGVLGIGFWLALIAGFALPVVAFMFKNK